MRNASKLLTICFLFLALTGCKNAAANPADTQPSSPGTQAAETQSASTSAESMQSEQGTLQAADYFPITKNTAYEYLGEGNEYASYTVYNDYTSENQVQQRVDNGGTVMAKVLTLADGKLTLTFSSGEVYYRENLLRKTGDEEILLAEPIAEGATWKLDSGDTRSITSLSVPVSTPSGDYDAIEVTTKGSAGTTAQYYARDVGLVKAVYEIEGLRITSTLSSIRTEVPSSHTVRFFYPDADNETVRYEDRTLDFYTNDLTREKLADAYRDVPAGTADVFSENTAVNSLSLHDDAMVYLDLNQAFLSEMNAGSGYESLILQSVADTFGYFYNTDKVLLTVEGKSYSSGHFEFKKGEYLQADPESAVPLGS